MFEPGSATGTIDVSTSSEDVRRVSAMADGMTGSEILRIAGEVRALTEAGKKVCNLTVGDFSPAEFRIPTFLEHEITEALKTRREQLLRSAYVTALRTDARIANQAAKRVVEANGKV